MRNLTKVKPGDLHNFFEGLTLAPVMKGDKITALELEQDGKVLSITQDGTYSPDITCHLVEEGVFEERFVLRTPRGDLLFDIHSEADSARSSLGFGPSDAPIEKKRVRVDAGTGTENGEAA